ncbi:MAG: 2-C-methyl-D-erythritol 4-phosphate cytidylyltransferase [Bacteroidota bacterium]
MKRAVIIVAGGSGTRMNSPIPKQFLEVAGSPVLLHAMRRFLDYDPKILMVVVLPPDYRKEWEERIRREQISAALVFAVGGETRFQSVKNGLSHVGGSHLTAIHDAARPLVSRETIGKCFDAAERHGGAIPVTGIGDSLRLIRDKGSEPIDRNRIKRVQTPQVFLTERILKAYDQAYQETFTDDAVVYETVFGAVELIEGNRENIKITYPEDLEYAERILSAGKA